MDANVDWMILSQCDCQIVRDLVEYDNREAKNVGLRTTRNFYKWIQTKKPWKSCYETLLAAYDTISSDFKIVHDEYGGYKMMYIGKKCLRAKTVLVDGPKGFIKPIVEGTTDLSVITKTSDLSQSYLMLGPVRFVNSDCEPNCEYDFSCQDTTIVRLRTLKTIHENMEINVMYGPEFFDEEECCCLTCQFKRPQNDRSFPDNLTDNEAELNSEEKHENCLETSSADGTEAGVNSCNTANIQCKNLSMDNEISSVNKKRKRLSGLQKFREYNNAMNAIQLEVDAPESFPAANVDQSFENSGLLDLSVELCAHIESYENYQLDNFQISDPIAESLNVKRSWISSPLPVFELPCLDISCLENSFVTPNIESSVKFFQQPLYQNARLSKNNACILIRAYSSKNHLSDAAQANLIKMLSAFIPSPNVLPSMYSLVRAAKKSLDEMTLAPIKTSNGRLCLIKVSELLKEIVQRNLSSIINYNIHRSQSNHEDCPIDQLSLAEAANELPIDLALSTDGANFISTSMKHNMYPVWLSILQLPPILRVSKKNIALGALWVGEGKPDWKLVTTHLEQELKRIVAVNFPSEKTVFLKFTVSFIVCDLIAKPSVLNMFQHNGFYGCNFCDHPGVTIDGSHAYYSQKITHKNKRYQVPWEIRDSNLHESYVEKAENLKREGRTGINVVGVKGRSEFSRLVKGTYQT